MFSSIATHKENGTLICGLPLGKKGGRPTPIPTPLIGGSTHYRMIRSISLATMTMLALVVLATGMVSAAPRQQTVVKPQQTATPTPEPTATPTPPPTATLSPTATATSAPVPTPAPVPTATVTPMPAPAATMTPVPVVVPPDEGGGLLWLQWLLLLLLAAALVWRLGYVYSRRRR